MACQRIDPRGELVRCANGRGLPFYFVCLLASLVVYSPAWAGLSFVFDQSSYVAAINSKVDVDVVLEATGTDRDYLLGTSAGRIFALGVRVNNNNVATGANILSDADISPNTVIFDDPIITPLVDRGVGFARVAAFTNNPDGVALLAPVPSTAPLRVRLATFSYTAGAVADVVTTLSFVDFDASVNIAASDGVGGAVVLDGLINFSNTATITAVTAVPEPGSLLMLSLACATLLSRRALAPGSRF